MCSVTGTKPPVHLPRKAANTENLSRGRRKRQREMDGEEWKEKQMRRNRSKRRLKGGNGGSRSESDSLEVRAGGKGLLRVTTLGADWT